MTPRVCLVNFNVISFNTIIVQLRCYENKILLAVLAPSKNESQLTPPQPQLLGSPDIYIQENFIIHSDYFYTWIMTMNLLNLNITLITLALVKLHNGELTYLHNLFSIHSGSNEEANVKGFGSATKSSCTCIG